MFTNWEDALEILPAHMRDGMRAYIDYGVQPGGFLASVLENDFIHAYLRADMINKKSLPEYIMFLYHYAPEECWGNRLKVQKWIASGGLTGVAEKQREDEEC